MTFDEAFDILIGHEGGYVNDSRDPGGATNWGITQRVAAAAGYRGDMRDFTRDAAKAIYRKQYWDAVSADKLPGTVQFNLFDAAVNSGVATAIKWLQRTVGAVEDGEIGPQTILAARMAGPLLGAHYLGVRLRFMTDLPTWGAFGKGWARRIAANLQRLE